MLEIGFKNIILCFYGGACVLKCPENFCLKVLDFCPVLLNNSHATVSNSGSYQMP